MPTTEHTINDAIAARLRLTRHGWRRDNVVSSENTGMLKGSSQRPDILVIEPNVSPVVVETEVLPAVTVEAEAKDRLGKVIRTNGRPILSAIAVRLPANFRTKSGEALDAAIGETDKLQMAMFTGTSEDKYVRWPATGWIQGTLADLSLLTQAAALPPEVVEAAAEILVSGVSEAAGLIEEMTASHPAAVEKICEELKQENVEQTRRMATTILANAFVFHGSLARGPGDLAEVQEISELRTPTGISKTAVLAEWRKILDINYWPIFDIARRILEKIPSGHSGTLIESMAGTADRLLESRLMRSHDLTGAVFQKLIADRKFLAAFYTTPASAALLVGLVINPDRPLAKGWGDARAVTGLRIADFACGTGTLLSTAYQRIGQLHELAGGNSETIHPAMMATALVGCDVLPAAAHLTASMLAGAHPSVKYSQSSILSIAYGLQEDGGVALGSLDLLSPQGVLGILSITAHAAEGMGEAEKETWGELPHASFDVVLMNPPFTRATGHHEINNVGVPNPVFAAFSSTEDEQEMMAAATKRLTQGTSAHGNAGEASIFLVLGNRKLKIGGILGLVMPLSLMSGEAWEDSRLTLKKNYTDLILVTISGAGEDNIVSFSADTGMGECLVIGAKQQRDDADPAEAQRRRRVGNTRATFVVLKQRPTSTLLGANCANQIRELIKSQELRRLEDGPVGGTPLAFGSEEIGHVLDGPLPESGGWNLSRIADLELAQTAYQLANSRRIWLPTMSEAQAVSVPIALVSSIGSIGPGDRDINGEGSNGGLRGPFTIANVAANVTPTYPVLWAHDAERERTMEFPGDSVGRPRTARSAAKREIIAEKVAKVFGTASHCHFNRDFRFNSQSTGMQFTPRKTIGGRAWPSIQLATIEFEKALVVWANTSLGVLLYWWYANKTQPGRGSILRSNLESFPVLDVSTLSKKKLEKAVELFDQTRHTQFLPIHQIDTDLARHALDSSFGQHVLGLPVGLLGTNGPLDLVRKKLAAEPSIRGHKADAQGD
jgi:hypothetical protein